MIKLMICCALCIMSGCATTTYIQEWVPIEVAPGDEPQYALVKEYQITAKGNAQIEYRSESGAEVIINNDGEPSLISQWFQAMIINDPTAILNGGDDDDD